MNLLARLLQRIAMWLVWNVPLGRFAPAVFGFAIGSKGKQIKPSSTETNLTKETP